jgi:hypothetical protein
LTFDDDDDDDNNMITGTQVLAGVAGCATKLCEFMDPLE